MSQPEKNSLMLCELHYPPIHGKTADSDPHIETHYLVYECFDLKTDSQDKIIETKQFLKNHYAVSEHFDVNKYGEHPTIRNYHNIIRRPNYIKLEIGNCIILPTFEMIAILKTFWLRIIQRKWKKVFKERKQILRIRKLPQSLREREITGSWPEDCVYLPGLSGMLLGL